MTPAALALATVTGNVQDPDWTWWIIAYFFVGGIAGGAYLISAVSDLFADGENRPVARTGYLLAFPLVALCGLILIADLNRHERFWHMLWNVTTNQPAFKYWSPMSYGSWVLAIFGALSFLSFVFVLAERMPALRGLAGLRDGPLGKVIAAIGAIFALLFASYTGAVLNATNQRVWGDNTMLGALFAVSAISTGIAAIALLLSRGRARHGLAMERLERADMLAMAVELILIAVLVVWLVVAGAVSTLIGGALGVVLILGVVLLGLLVPLALYLRPHLLGPRTAATAALLTLFGGLLLRAVILLAAQA